MLNSVNDVLTPWTPPRILRVMEAASASRSAVRGASDRSAPNTTNDAALAMESLLRLSNQQPDVAGRVMTAPLFALRPLVESTDPAAKTASSSSSSAAPPLVYGDAHSMCTHALERCRLGPRNTQQKATGDASSSSRAEASSSHVAPASSARRCGLSEIAFAAEFAEPCLRGSFPDVAAVVRHTLPPGCAPPLRGRVDANGVGKGRGGATDVFFEALETLLQEPAVSHRKAPVAENASAAAASAEAAPALSLRLNLAPSVPSPPSATLLSSSLPPASAVPIEAYGPPGHLIFCKTTVAHTFSNEEVRDLGTFMMVKQRPFRVYTAAEVEARRQQASHSQRRNAMLSAGAGAAPIVGPRGTTAASSLRGTALRGVAGKARSGEEEQDGWSASSGWSSDADNGSDEKNALQVHHLVAVEEVSSTRPATNRTWVDDDGDLVLENGKVSIRKRKVRVVKNAPPPLPLPTVVGGPVLRNPQAGPHSLHLSIAASEAVAVVEDVGGSFSAQTAGAKRRAEAEAEDVEDMKVLPMRKGGAGAKRGGAVGEDGQRGKVPPTAGRSARRVKQESAKKDSNGRKKDASGGRSAAVSTINTANAPLLEKSEMIDFVGRLPISKLLRRALLIGVESPVTSEKGEESEELEEDSTASDEDEG